MTEISLGQVEPACPNCGAKLLVQRDGIEPMPEDRVFCEACGHEETRESAGKRVLAEKRPEIIEAAREHAKDLLRKAFGKG